MPVIYTFSTGGTRPTIRSLTARTWCKGERIDLSWSAPAGAAVHSYIVKRSRRAFSLMVDDEAETIYTGTATSLSDVNLEENTVYYYTVYWSDDGTHYYVSDEGRVAGLSIRDYEAVDGSYWLYERLPAELRRHDALPGQNQYALRRYCDVLQCGLMLLRGKIEAYSHLTNADKMPAGRVGDPANQYGFLEELNKQWGFDPQHALGAEVMRRVALGITRVRKMKGTCPGLAEFIKLIAGWDGECSPVEDRGCGGGLLFKTWDGLSLRTTGSGQFDGPAFSSPTLVAAAGGFSDSAATWTPSLYARGVILDPMGQMICISNNDATSLTFENAADRVTFEDVFDSCTFSGFGTDTIVITQTVAGLKPFNTAMYDGYHLKTDFGTGKYLITSCSVNSAGTQLTMQLDAPTPGGATLCVVAHDYLNEPQAYDDRQISAPYVLLTGEHYLTWEPRRDARLRGTPSDPFDVLFGGGGAAGVSPISPHDVVFWVDPGVAEAVGTSTSLGATTLVDSSAAWTPGALYGMYLNPNRDQTQLYRIVANTATSVTVDSPIPLTTAGGAGDQYTILRGMDALRYQTVYNTVRRFLPYGTKLYLRFQ